MPRLLPLLGCVLLLSGCKSSAPSKDPFLRQTVPPPATGSAAPGGSAYLSPSSTPALNTSPVAKPVGTSGTPVKYAPQTGFNYQQTRNDEPKDPDAIPDLDSGIAALTANDMSADANETNELPSDEGDNEPSFAAKATSKSDKVALDDPFSSRVQKELTGKTPDEAAAGEEDLLADADQESVDGHENKSLTKVTPAAYLEPADDADTKAIAQEKAAAPRKLAVRTKPVAELANVEFAETNHLEEKDAEEPDAEDINAEEIDEIAGNEPADEPLAADAVAVPHSAKGSPNLVRAEVQSLPAAKVLTPNLTIAQSTQQPEDGGTTMRVVSTEAGLPASEVVRQSQVEPAARWRVAVDDMPRAVAIAPGGATSQRVASGSPTDSQQPLNVKPISFQAAAPASMAAHAVAHIPAPRAAFSSGVNVLRAGSRTNQPGTSLVPASNVAVGEGASGVAVATSAPIAAPASKTPATMTLAGRYAFEPDYGQLNGKLEYSQSQKRWKLRYIPIDGRTDRYGGSVVLADSPLLSELKAGDFVAVRGAVASTASGLGFAPGYELSQVERR